jgi:phosphohistidine phosphatase
MKTIYIVRHAKSSWAYEGIEDFDRPLSQRGIEDAYLVSKELLSKIQRPDIFVTSYAIRALHTAIIFAENFKFPVNHLYIKKSLYNFSDGYLAKTISALDDAYDSAIIFSHEHGISAFVNKYGSKNVELIPTCGLVGLKFDISHWKDLKKGETIISIFPKDLKDIKKIK